mmetsp:Transcript_18981/g.47020  ORF Transcript_18981/g.47020 Transcript_18981/m.47020 type:complete len:299 (+) Transcript_18981:879-1775(+)
MATRFWHDSVDVTQVISKGIHDSEGNSAIAIMLDIMNGSDWRISIAIILVVHQGRTIIVGADGFLIADCFVSFAWIPLFVGTGTWYSDGPNTFTAFSLTGTSTSWTASIGGKEGLPSRVASRQILGRRSTGSMGSIASHFSLGCTSRTGTSIAHQKVNRLSGWNILAHIGKGIGISKGLLRIGTGGIPVSLSTSVIIIQTLIKGIIGGGRSVHISDKVHMFQSHAGTEKSPPSMSIVPSFSRSRLIPTDTVFAWRSTFGGCFVFRNGVLDTLGLHLTCREWSIVFGIVHGPKVLGHCW